MVRKPSLDMMRDSRYIGGGMLKMEVPVRRQRGRPKRRFMDVLREDIQIVGVKEEEAKDREMEEDVSLWQLLKKKQPY